MAYTNNQVVSSFMNNNREECQNGSGSLEVKMKQINGLPTPVLYSYGEHFPLAVLLGRYALMNDERYSSTTSQHQSLVKRYGALNYTVQLDTASMKAIVRHYDFNPAIQFLLDEADKLYAQASRRRVEDYREMDMKRAARITKQATELAKLFSVELDPTLSKRFRMETAA